jgi:hypothetical protein
MLRTWIPLLFCLGLSVSLGLFSDALSAENVLVRVEHSKPLPPPGNSLGTTIYAPSPAEKLAVKDWTEEELSSGSPQTGSLKGAPGRHVCWFGIIRKITEDKPKKVTRLLVEMKYFDGLTDLHLQVVSISGAGDFQVAIPETGHQLKNLSLVRVCGKVSGEEAGLPVVTAEYVRDWDWGLFTFMPYGDDKSNPEWVKLRKVDPDNIYSSRPNPKFYEARLGMRALAEAGTEWQTLFEGSNLNAWNPKSSSPPDEWTVNDGILSTRPTGDGWLKSQEVFSDFELRLEFRLSPKANSGVFLRADGSTPHVSGLEVQLLDDAAFPDGPNSRANGALMLESGPKVRASKKAGEWQSLLVKCEGPKVTVKLNDQLVIEEDFTLNPDREAEHPGRKSTQGHIGLQNRGEKVEFRRIEIRKLK